MLNRHWTLPGEHYADAETLVNELGCLPIVAQILWRRGYRDAQTAHAFLTPLDQRIDCPVDLTDMQLAVDRIARARVANERVRVFGDYDVDGIAATALMVRALRRFGIANLEYYVPDRESDGYGISSEHVRDAAAAGVGLIITVDNGISAHEAARTARELGVDLVVTDHHHFNGELPAAVACVNPRREDSGHPLYNVSGTTVAWLLARELLGDADNELGYVALGTIADVIPLTGINRLLVRHGLEQLSRNAILGINTLATRAKLQSRNLRSEDIAFQIAPRLNAAGRLGNATVALDLLLTEDKGEADRLSAELDEANLTRREIERAIFQEALDRLGQEWDPDSHTIVLGSESWPRGIIGIVAAKIAEAYERPTALLSLDSDGFAYASARSRPGFDLMEALAACDGRLQKYGGHRGAAGFTLARSDLEHFKIEFEQAAAATRWQAVPEVLQADAILSLTELNPRLLDEVSQLEPFGSGNPEPLFCTCGASIPQDSVRVYKGGHLGLRVYHNQRQFGAIAFRMGDHASSLQAASGPYDVLYRPKLNTFRGQTTVQLHIQAIRASIAG